MKKLVFTSIILFAFVFSSYAQVEEVAKEILKAYKDRDAELLKKNASGMLKMSINDSYFEADDLQEALKIVDDWDGKIKEIRYTEENMMGKKINIAAAHFADNPENDEIYWVGLSRMGNSDWVMFAKGLTSDTREEFEKMSPSMGDAANRKEKRAEKAAKNKKFSVEMANGETYDSISDDKLKELINSLDDDNFFMILNKGDEDFLQTAYSENGYSLQYKEKGEQFQTGEMIDKEKATEVFTNYYNEKSDWKEGINWEAF